MRQEIRDRLAEKIPLTATPKRETLAEGLPELTKKIVESLELPPLMPPDNRLWLKLTTGTSEAIMLVPENVACNYRARYGKAPGFEKWFMDRVRDLLNAS